jgi:hypothetical protein
MDTKTCRLCGETKPKWEFHLRSQSKDGRATACKPCAIAESNRSRMKPRPILPEKTCTMCGKIKPLEDFVRNKNFFDGRNHVCKGCLYEQRKQYGEQPLNKSKLNAAQARRYWSDHERALDNHVSHIYGLKRGTYQSILDLQNGRCAICQRDTNPGKHRFAIDHCHDTREIRGLLCTPCNQAIGQLQHSAELLRRAIDYLNDPPARQLSLLKRGD